MIYSRAQWGADERMRDKSLAALRRGARRVRAPHGQREQLHRRPGARDHPRHLRVPHAVPRLVRHRLQLPRRPLRPDLGGPVRRRRPSRRRRAHARLQRRRVRDVRDRQLRDRPAAGRRCSTPTAGCSPGSSACTASSAGSHAAVGDQAGTSRRSTGTATSARPPAPASTSTPRSRRSGTLAAAYQKSFASRNRTANLAGTAAPGRRRCATRPPSRATCCAPAGSPASPPGTVAASGLSGADLRDRRRRRHR